MRIGGQSYPGFRAVRIPATEFWNPLPSREGERVVWPDGRVRSFPPPGADTVTVLRRAGKGRGGPKA